MAKSEALKIAEISSRTQLTSQAMSLLQDPLWSTIAGFVLVNALRKRDLVGPVADDVLYAGIIAINTARQPALMDLAGRGLELAVAGIAGAAGGAIAARGPAGPITKISRGGKVLVGKTKQLPLELQTLAATGSTLTLIPPGAFSSSKDRPIWKKVFGLA